MDYKRFNIKKEENWGFISLALGIISLPLIILFPISVVVAFFGFVLGLIYMLNNKGFGWDEEKKLAFFGAIISVVSIIINMVLFVIGILYIRYFG